MSKIAQYKALEAQLAEQLRQLDALKNDKELKQEMEFEKKLQALMDEYGVNLRTLISMLEPQPSANAAQLAVKRAERKLKTYKHPETGEVVETKGGNNRVLRAWKAEFGADVVEGWLQR